MASAREMRSRIKSVKNISQVTRALEAVSAAKVRKAIQALSATRSYATKAWQVLTHITNQPGGISVFCFWSGTLFSQRLRAASLVTVR